MTIVDIYNAALSAIGHDQVVTAITATTAEASWCNRFYAQGRKELLRQAKPSWAVAFEDLDDQADCTHPDWEYEWPVPGDMLAVVAVKDADGRHAPFRIFGDQILTLIDEGVVEFVQDTEDVDAFDPLFTRALIYRLAADVALPLTGKADVKRIMEQAYASALVDCRSADANDARDVGDPADPNYYVTVRSGGG